MIFSKSARTKLLFVVGAGLPDSGTTSLIRGIVNLTIGKKPHPINSTFTKLHFLKIRLSMMAIYIIYLVKTRMTVCFF